MSGHKFKKNIASAFKESRPGCRCAGWLSVILWARAQKKSFAFVNNRPVSAPNETELIKKIEDKLGK
ncbi:hypothetical protein GCM10020331_021760 [Ectobacillus funiculus]